MRLTVLQAQFIGLPTPTTHPLVETLAEAGGIMFLCPLCYIKHGGAEGTHRVLVWFEGRGVPRGAVPLPRWRVSGTGMEDLSLSPSIQLLAPEMPGVPRDQVECRWHGFVRGGDAT